MKEYQREVSAGFPRVEGFVECCRGLITVLRPVVWGIMDRSWLMEFIDMALSRWDHTMGGKLRTQRAGAYNGSGRGGGGGWVGDGGFFRSGESWGIGTLPELHSA